MAARKKKNRDNFLVNRGYIAQLTFHRRYGSVSSPDFIYPERYFIVEGIKQLNGITAIKVTYPKNKKIRCTILSIDGDLDGYDNLKEIRVNDTAFLNLLPVYITESNEKALKMIPDSIQVNPDPWYPIYSHLKPEVWDELISRNYTYTGFNIDADYSDGGLDTARNLVGKYLIQDGATSPNMPDRFFIRAWDYAHTGAIPSFGKVFKVYIRK